MKSPHKHHIIPKYHCEELGIDPDFDENIVEVDRLDHARIHWGYKCDDLEPLFEYITPAQWIIDLIPRGDNRDVGAAVITAKGEIDGIDISGENHPMWKGGVTNDKEYQLKKKRERYWKNPEESRKKTAAKMRKLRAKWKQDPAWQEKINKQDRERRARKKAERQGAGTLEPYL